MDANSLPSAAPKMFGDFPLSIRIAQRSVVLAILIPIVLRALLKPAVGRNAPWLTFSVLGASGLCIAVGIATTYYAVIRYPYMGLIDAADGDLFAKHIESRQPWVRKTAVALCLAIAAAGMVLPWNDGQITRIESLIILYSASVFFFVIFLIFFYHRSDHPTIAIFLRCSMGLGIFLYPVFLPALVLGAMRVNTLLDEAIIRIETEKKQRPVTPPRG
jgi:hypothetical protein